MKYLSIGILLLVLSFTLNGQTIDEADSSIADSRHKTFHNHAALFLGVTTFDRNGNSFFSLGADYVHRWDPDKPWAVGILGEVILQITRSIF